MISSGAVRVTIRAVSPQGAQADVEPPAPGRGPAQAAAQAQAAGAAVPRALRLRRAGHGRAQLQRQRRHRHSQGRYGTRGWALSPGPPGVKDGPFCFTCSWLGVHISSTAQGAEKPPPQSSLFTREHVRDRAKNCHWYCRAVNLVRH